MPQQIQEFPNYPLVKIDIVHQAATNHHHADLWSHCTLYLLTYVHATLGDDEKKLYHDTGLRLNLIWGLYGSFSWCGKIPE